MNDERIIAYFSMEMRIDLESLNCGVVLQHTRASCRRCLLLVTRVLGWLFGAVVAAFYNISLRAV